MKSSGLVIAFLLALLLSPVSGFSKTKIRVLTWWDYISPEVIKKLEKSGFEIDLSLYKSNEVAFSRLVSKGSSFDVIIISGAIIQSVNQVVRFENLPNRQLEGYLPFLKQSEVNCIPYLWSATVFSVYGNEVVENIEDLISLKSKGYTIALIDDSFEILARVALDQKCKADHKTVSFDWRGVVSCLKKSATLQKIDSNDLKSTTGDYLTKRLTAAYGWHGELFPALKNHGNEVQVYVPKINPVIGADYVCVIEKKNSKKEIQRFVSLLTDRESTKLNVKSTGYFSPYVGQVDSLHPRIQEVYRTILNKTNLSNPVLLSAPPIEIHEQINQIWQKIRYEKK